MDTIQGSSNNNNTTAIHTNVNELVSELTSHLEGTQVNPPSTELPTDYTPQSTDNRNHPGGRDLFKRRNGVLYSIDEFESTTDAFGDGKNSVTHHKRCDLTDYVTVTSRFRGENYSPTLSNTVQTSRGSGRNALFVMDATSRPVSLPLGTLGRSRARQSTTYDQHNTNLFATADSGKTEVFKATTTAALVSRDDTVKMATQLESGDTPPNKVYNASYIFSPQKCNISNDVSMESVDFVKTDKCPDFGARYRDKDFSCSEDIEIESSSEKACLLTGGHVPILQIASNTGGAIVPPPPPPPPPPSGYSSFSNVFSPTKPLIRPKSKMRPLFWKKIVFEGTSEDKQPESFWGTSKEPPIDADELERLFGVTASLDSEAVQFSMSPRHGKGKQVGKVLDDKRSRDVAIKISRLQMSMEEVQDAIYKMDAKKLDLDRLQGLYNMRATEKELSEIKRFKQENKDIVLDKPEEFLLQLAEVHSLQDRLECWIFTERFTETMFNLHQQMNSLMSACSELRQSEYLHAVLRLVLAAGNYMNGCTPRGQADGYQLDILTKLRDVRTKDKSGNLLQYIVRQYCRRSGDCCDPDGRQFRLPSPELMKTARQTCLKDSRKSVHSMGEGLKRVKGLVQKLLEGSEASMVTSFRCKMKPFLFHAELTLKREVRRLDEVEDTFKELFVFFDCKDPDLDDPSSFFEIWERFCQDFHDCWTDEQKQLAKEMFQNVENDKKARRNSTTTRELTECSKGSLLKARFSRQNSLTDLQDGEVAKSSENGVSTKHAEITARNFDTLNVSPKFTSPDRPVLDNKWGSNTQTVHDKTDDDMDLLKTIDECQNRPTGSEVSHDLGCPDDSSLVSASYVHLTDEPPILDDKEIRGTSFSQRKASDDSAEAHGQPNMNWGYYEQGQARNHDSPDPTVRVMYQGSTLVVSL
ncbi:FMN2 [Branchiostoma lanceolatum]|uniref:FMN2 protein n=1 Tax=Branchiostoma lanceolatum TaxID=7740 RepID=A0A8K0A8S6_BRALA|nr:FMN2 [Branchiostoma lanceolatum]